ncbi:MAG: hypothetical protein RLZZ387_4785 [Chloroflexota bacterium]|jgi:sugar lactone lactonase YvrE
MRRFLWPTALALVFAALLAHAAPTARAAETFPSIIDLPDGFQPEGVVTGRGPIIYAGSLANGAIYAADLLTGESEILVQGQPGRVAVGLSFDDRTGYLFVAGGPTGIASVYDTATGTLVQQYTLGAGFINDVIVTRDAAYFTNSAQAVLYVLPLGPGGSLPAQGDVQTIPLSGDWQQVAGFNANGIEATPNGKTLIVVNSSLGALFTVDPSTGIATRIDLGSASVSNGDGLLLDGKTLYVVRNRLNQIAAVRLSSDYSSGQIVDTITSPDFRVPTTVAEFRNGLYAVNARFGTAPSPSVDYEIVRVDKR